MKLTIATCQFPVGADINENLAFIRRQMKIAKAALVDALEIVGGKSAMAVHLGITPQALTPWEIVPAARVLVVYDATGVLPEFLRPDRHRPPPKEAAA